MKKKHLRPFAIRRARNSSGFTLMELVLAMLIGSIVMGILSVALSFCLRLWEREQNRQTSEMPRMVELLKGQLASYDATKLKFDTETHILFSGSAQSLTIATTRSVRSISRGVPVVARYVFVPEEKRLYYAELILDPYHQDQLAEFLKMKPAIDDKSWPAFYFVDVDDCVFSYQGDEDEYAADWEDETRIPRAVLVKWKETGQADVQSCAAFPNVLFGVKVDQAGKSDTTQDGSKRKSLFNSNRK
ncbi:MAG: type II secretion system protein J [Acidobacteriota bacterium]